MKYYNILDPAVPFDIRGLAVKREGGFRRLPDDVADAVSDGVRELSRHSAGARVRFSTASKNVYVRYALHSTGVMNHMALSGQSGVDALFDLCGDEPVFGGCVRPDSPEKNSAEGGLTNVRADGKTVFGVTLHLPLYNGITHMEIAVDDGAQILAARPYAIDRPIVFYGSSITQGGCASDPSSAYTAIIGEELDADHINLGFSGSAHGETIMAKYIAGLDMSAFVYDYDHNAANLDEYRATHKPFFDIVRASHRTLPIVIVTRPNPDVNWAEADARDAVAMETFESAVQAGDRNVYFIPGRTLFGASRRWACTVDTCHPTDLGFSRMADVIGDKLREILK